MSHGFSTGFRTAGGTKVRLQRPSNPRKPAFNKQAYEAHSVHDEHQSPRQRSMSQKSGEEELGQVRSYHAARPKSAIRTSVQNVKFHPVPEEIKNQRAQSKGGRSNISKRSHSSRHHYHAHGSDSRHRHTKERPRTSKPKSHNKSYNSGVDYSLNNRDRTKLALSHLSKSIASNAYEKVEHYKNKGKRSHRPSNRSHATRSSYVQNIQKQLQVERSKREQLEE